MTKTQCILPGNLKDSFEEISGIKTTNDAMMFRNKCWS